MPVLLATAPFLLLLVHFIVSFLNNSLGCLNDLGVPLLLAEHEGLEERHAMLMHTIVEGDSINLNFLDVSLDSVLHFLILGFPSEIAFL